MFTPSSSGSTEPTYGSTPYSVVSACELKKSNGSSSASSSRKRSVLDFECIGELVKFIESSKTSITFVDACFTDILGASHRCTYSADQFYSEEDVENGLSFDGSSIPLFCDISSSDLVMKPDYNHCWFDPFSKFPTLNVTCSVFTSNGLPYHKCPREILKRCQTYLRDMNIADEAIIGPEAEFFILDSMKCCITPNHVEYSVDGEEAYWNNHSKMTSTIIPRHLHKRSYMSVKPADVFYDLRCQILHTLKESGVVIEKHHHEVASCQMEVGIKCCPMVEAADNITLLKYVVKNVAAMAGKSATFMPKPLMGDNGSGMHCNVSLWKDSVNLFVNNNAADTNTLSPVALHFIAGLLKHGKALFPLICPTVNSYRRLVPGFEAPVIMAYSVGNRSAAIRIPEVSKSKCKRIEFRTPDASSCPHLAFAAILMAGIDGILNKIEPPPPIDGDMFNYTPPAKKTPLSPEIEEGPASLEAALDQLEADNEFLTKGNVFSSDFIQEYIKFKRAEAASFRPIPHPREYELYYAC